MVAVRQVMSTEVVTLPGATPMATAARHMVRRGIGSVLVVDGTMLSGILTERDVLRAAGKATDMAGDPISRWMSPEPVSCAPGIDTEEAAEMMLSGGFRHLPVLDGTDLAGIVSLRDVLSARIGRKG